MCGEDHDFRLCRAQDGAHRGLAVFRVEAGERLVERERVGWREQRSSECQPALHAAGIIAYLLFPHVAKSQFFQERLRRRGVVIRAEDEAKISLCVQPFEQAVFLKDRRPAKFIAVDRAAVRRFQPEQHAQQRRLADAGGTEQARHADARGKGNVVKHRILAVALAKVFDSKLHHAPILSAILSTRRRNSFSNAAEISTIAAVQAKRSAVWKYIFAL